MKYDLIIVVCSSSKKLIDITQQCIDSARQDNADMNVIIIETHPVLYNYPDCEIIQYPGEFCYNKALNIGINHAECDVFILANNDLIFYPGWSQIGDLMSLNRFESASAISSGHIKKGLQQGDYIYAGYNIEWNVTGWCLFVTRKCIETIGSLDESFQFWHSDNVYADQLKAKGIRHGLFCNIRVDHLRNATLRTVSIRLQRRYTSDAVRQYKLMQKLIKNAV